jgi:hypothetical protein
VVIPPLRLQVSDCCTLWIVCDIPRIAVIVNLLNVFLIWLPNFSLNLFVNILVAPSYYWYNLTFQVPLSLYLHT